MLSTKDFFNWLSYLQYPLMLISLGFMLKPVILGNKAAFLKDYNSALIFMGLSITFSTLQDTTKTQNKLSLTIYQSRWKSRVFFCMIGGTILTLIGVGLYAMLTTNKMKLQELAVGMVVLGMSIIGLLKSAMEMGEHHLAEFESKLNEDKESASVSSRN